MERLNAAFLESEGRRGRMLITGQYSYVDKELQLGSLNGNRFGITLRQLAHATEATGAEARDLAGVVREACDGVVKHGFINFFGLQRFGSGGSPSCEIGKRMLLCDWKGAVETILLHRDGDSEDAMIAKHIYLTTKNADKAFTVMPPWVRVRLMVYALLPCRFGGGNRCCSTMKPQPICALVCPADTQRTHRHRERGPSSGASPRTESTRT